MTIEIKFPTITVEVLRNPNYMGEGPITNEDGITFIPATFRFSDKEGNWAGTYTRHLPLGGVEDTDNFWTPEFAKEMGRNFQQCIWNVLRKATNDGKCGKQKWWEVPHQGKPLGEYFKYNRKPTEILNQVDAKF
jgi:hypothetical protein